MFFQILIIALLVLALITFAQTLYLGKVFAICIRPGIIKVRKGTPPAKFIADCKEIMRKKPVRGYIYGVWEGEEFRLEFTKSIPDTVAQRFRNVFPYTSYSPNNPNDKGPCIKRNAK